MLSDSHRLCHLQQSEFFTFFRVRLFMCMIILIFVTSLHMPIFTMVVVGLEKNNKKT